MSDVAALEQEIADLRVMLKAALKLVRHTKKCEEGPDGFLRPCSCKYYQVTRGARALLGEDKHEKKRRNRTTAGG